MNNKFKRVLSSLLAFVMLLSCVTVMNVSSVWAEGKAVPSDADSSAYYVGFDTTEGYKVYSTVQGAIDVAPAGSTIYIYPGEYEEKVTISKTDISLVNWATKANWTGEQFSSKTFVDYGKVDTSTNAVVITHKYACTAASLNYNLYAGTQDSATVTVKGDGFKAKGITFQNSYNRGTEGLINNTDGKSIVQAVALVTIADKVELDNCRFLGVQDTLYLKTGTYPNNPTAKRVYVKDSYIEGGVDFIFGDATAFFDNCKLYMVSNGYYTAPNTSAKCIGFVFNKCYFDMASGITAYMARGWQNTTAYPCVSSNMVLVNCTAPSGINAARYNSMSATDVLERTRYFEDSNTFKADSTFKFDRKLETNEAALYTLKNVLGYDNGTWGTALESATGITFTNGNKANSENKEVPDDYTEMYSQELKVGETDNSVTLAAQVIGGTGSENITWATSNDSVATVDNGVVKAVGAGTCEITAKLDNGAVATSYVKVVDPSALNITIDYTSADLLKKLYTDGYKAGTTTGTVKDDTTDVTYYYEGYANYNAYQPEQYGFKIATGKLVLSVPANSKSDYVFAITGNKTGTANIYTDEAKTNLVATAPLAGGTSTVRYINEQGTGTLYLELVSGDDYIKTINISTEPLTVASEITVKPAVTGLEADDTDAEITFKGSTGDVTVKASELATTGVKLLNGIEYDVTARGKGVYKGEKVTASSDLTSIALTRIELKFPMDLQKDYNDYNLFFGGSGNLVTYTNGVYTDPYSGIMIYNQGLLPNGTKYGAKTNANNIMAVKADKAGKYTFAITTTANGTGEQVQLAVNDTAVESTLTTITGNAEYKMSVTVNENDIIRLFTPTRSNLYYGYVDLTYEPVAANVFSFKDAVLKDSKLYVIGKVSATDAESAEKVGFGAGLSEATAKTSAVSDRWLDTDKVANKVAVGTDDIAPVTEGTYFAAFEIDMTGAESGKTVYVVPFTTVGSSTVYGNATAAYTVE